MFEKKRQTGPFLIDKLIVMRSNFLGSPVKSKIVPSYEFGCQGDSTTFNSNHSIKATLGEHLERTSVYTNNGRYVQNEIYGYDITNDREVKIPLKKILLCYHSNVIKNEITKSDFNDSCGIASHKYSDKAINNAFLEFMERQSFIINWLSQSKGKIINKNIISELNLDLLYKMCFNYVDEVLMYDISIHNDVSVVLSIGIGEQYFGLGLSADWTLKGAIQGSLEEMFQFFSDKKNKYTVSKDLKHKNEEVLSLDFNDPHAYSKYLFSFNSNEIANAYSYLQKSDETVSRSESSFNSKNSNIYNKIKDIGRELGIEIIIASINRFNKNVPIKIVKVLSFSGFPHMRTDLLMPEENKLMKNIGIVSFPNKGKLIPFP
jgi:ribosomal protein S12 methylthiotransferase accessory factor YcaO